MAKSRCTKTGLTSDSTLGRIQAVTQFHTRKRYRKEIPERIQMKGISSTGIKPVTSSTEVRLQKNQK